MPVAGLLRPEPSANALPCLQQRHARPGSRKRLGGGQACHAGAHHDNFGLGLAMRLRAFAFRHGYSGIGTLVTFPTTDLRRLIMVRCCLCGERSISPSILRAATPAFPATGAFWFPIAPMTMKK